MQAIQFIVPQPVTDTSISILYDHPMITAGTLLLLDFSHPNGELSGIPTTNQTINNIAWDIAESIIGTGSQSTLSPTVTNSIVSGSGLMEITAKKGLHGIISQVSDFESSNNFIIKIPPLIIDYVNTHVSHGFYYAISYNKTRLHLVANSADMLLAAPSTSQYLSIMQATSTLGQQLGSSVTPALTVTGSHFRDAAFNARTGATATPSEYNTHYKFGSYGPFSSFEINKAPSQILYNLYIEDLTISGRTYAQAHSSSLAYHNENFATGGKYYNDSFTNPSTLP